MIALFVHGVVYAVYNRPNYEALQYAGYGLCLCVTLDLNYVLFHTRRKAILALLIVNSPYTTSALLDFRIRAKE